MSTIVLGGTGMWNTFLTTSSTRKSTRSLPKERAGIVDRVLAKMDELDEMKLWFFK